MISTPRPGVRPSVSDDGPQRQLTALGWATSHQDEDHGTEFLVYGPRDDHEVDVVLSIIAESLAFARDPGDEQPGHGPV